MGQGCGDRAWGMGLYKIPTVGLGRFDPRWVNSYNDYNRKSLGFCQGSCGQFTRAETTSVYWPWRSFVNFPRRKDMADVSEEPGVIAEAIWWARILLPFLAAPSLVWGWRLYRWGESEDRRTGKQFLAFGALCGVGAAVSWLV